MSTAAAATTTRMKTVLRKLARKRWRYRSRETAPLTSSVVGRATSQQNRCQQKKPPIGHRSKLPRLQNVPKKAADRLFLYAF